MNFLLNLLILIGYYSDQRLHTCSHPASHQRKATTSPEEIPSTSWCRQKRQWIEKLLKFGLSTIDRARINAQPWLCRDHIRIAMICSKGRQTWQVTNRTFRPSNQTNTQTMKIDSISWIGVKGQDISRLSIAKRSCKLWRKAKTLMMDFAPRLFLIQNKLIAIWLWS